MVAGCRAGIFEGAEAGEHWGSVMLDSRSHGGDGAGKSVVVVSLGARAKASCIST